MDLSQLFPNSPQNAFERILNDKHNGADVKIVRDALKEEAFNRSPIQISTAYMRESNGRETHFTIIRRGESYMEDGHSSIKGRAEYNTARWKHVLLGHDEPDILKFDTDPTAICNECNETYTTHTNSKKCGCIPF